jgi:hypothetical protein
MPGRVNCPPLCATAGWVPGNVYLDPAVTGRIGAEAFVF